MNSNSRIMSSLKQIEKDMDNILIWDDWYFVESEDAEPGEKIKAKDEDEEEEEEEEEEDEEMEEEEGEVKEEGQDEDMKEEEGEVKEEGQDEVEEEEEEEEAKVENKEEEEDLLENLSIIRKFRETKMGSSSKGGNHHHQLSDQSSFPVTNHKLNGHNYLQWSQSVFMYICGKSKDDYLTGKKKAPMEEDPAFNIWKAENSMFTRFQLSPFFKKKDSKDIKILVKDYVLPFLPAKSLVRFRAVSMEWNQWIRSPFLAHQQSYSFQELSGYFYQQNEENIEFLTMNRCAYGVPKPSLSFLPEAVTIKSSSNGLLLCQDQNGYNTYYICNPVNQEWKELPQRHYYYGPKTAIVLAFEPSVLNMDASYQLICPVTSADQAIIFFEVYSSETRCWTESTTICLDLEAGSTLRDNGFYIKGTAYWETYSRKVLAFNPTNAIHEIISLPNHCPHGGILTEMGEELCYIGISSINGNDSFVEIYGGLYLDLKYKMKLHLQMALNWYRVLPCLNGNIVMILNGCAIHSYSLKDEKLELIGWNTGRSEGMYLPYVNSLVSVG